MKKLAVLTIVLSAVCLGSLRGQSFDRRVSEARLHMRSACQAVQGIAKAAAAEQAEMKRTAVGEAAQAETLWTGLVKEYSSQVPEGYAGDPAWAQRLEDIRLNISRMAKEASGDLWRPAFLSCAHACNLLAAMHEANGVTLAIDAMTVLRKKVGFARGFAAAGKLEKARVVVEDILAARDGVLLAPLPDTPSRNAYQEALPELSQAVDALAGAVRGGSDLKAALDRLAPLVERVYALAI